MTKIMLNEVIEAARDLGRGARWAGAIGADRLQAQAAAFLR
jgi:hypothetical protein